MRRARTTSGLVSRPVRVRRPRTTSADVIWRLVNNVDKAPQWAPTLIEVDPIQGRADVVGASTPVFTMAA
jgi:hypothetical protein